MQQMRSLLLRYGLAIGLAIVALLLTNLLPRLATEGVFILSLAGIVLTAWYGGRGPGLLATLLSALVIDYFFIPPVGSLTISSWEVAVVLIVFVAVAILLIEFSQVRRRDEGALQRSEERWKAVFEHNPTMYFMVDQAGIIVSVNPFGAEQLGYRVEELVGTSVLNIFYEADRNAVQRNVSACLADVGRPMTWEYRKIRKDGTIIWVRETAKAVAFGQSQPVMLIVCEDITVWKRAEEELVQKASLLDLTHDTIFVRDLQDVIRYWNRGAEELYGWTRAEAIGRVSHDLMETQFPAPLEEITAGLFRMGRWEGELVHRKRDGSRIVVGSRWSLQRDKDGNPVAILETNNDITDRKRAEKALRRSEKELLDVIETIPAMVWSTFPDGAADFFNRRWQEFTGLSLEKSLGWDWSASIHPEDFEQYMGEWRASMATGQPFEAEVRFRRAADGEYRWCLGRGVPLRDEQGTVLKWYGIVTDIDDRKRAEEAARKSQLELAHVARVATLGELTASIAHEINQPLGAIVNNAGACVRWLAAHNMEEARQSAQHVISDGHRASEIISRIRALVMKAPPRKEWMDINETIREVLGLTSSELNAHGVAFQTELSGDARAVLGDRIQLQQVLLNIIMNAIEAMGGASEGPRRLMIGSYKHDAEHIVVNVQDSGPGIDSVQLDRLFEAFYSTKPGGLGMGLAISRSIIKAHGGRLWATANQPRGARFHFTLPVDADGPV